MTRWRASPSFSKTGLKRNSLFLLLLILLGAPLFGDEREAHIEATRVGNSFTFELAVLSAPEEEILNSLLEGMRSEVEYRIQLYRESRGLLRFFGDRLVEEYETHYVAYFDPFTRSYRIDSSGAFDSGEQVFEDPNSFLHAFLSLRSNDLRLPEMGEAYRIRGRSIVRPVRIAPPLGLMGFFLSNNRYGTAWVSVEL